MDRTEASAALDRLALDINARLDAAEKHAKRAKAADEKADDFRLSAALQVAQARRVAKEAGIGWRAWSQKHIHRSYSDVKRLARIGDAPNPKLALADERQRARDAMRRSRLQQQQQQIEGPESPLPWIARRLDRLDRTELKQLAGMLVSRLPVEDLERMKNGLGTIIEKRKADG